MVTSSRSLPPSPARDLVLGGFFIALALVLPMAFHLLGAGTTFSPMHIPVFLAAFTTVPWVAVLVGLTVPLLSSLLTGMPPLSPPVAQGMVFELAFYALVTALVYRATRRIYLSWAAGAIAGRLVLGLFGAAVLPLFGFASVPLFYPLTAGLVSGLPGLAVQAVLVPTIVYAVERVSNRRATSGRGTAPGREGSSGGGVAPGREGASGRGSRSDGQSGGGSGEDSRA